MTRPTPKLTLALILAVGLFVFTGATATRASAAFALARTGSPRVASSAAARLNVVFIVSDDERVNGNAVMKDVQRLIAKHGVTFTNFHVTTSECGPSRASILTGLYGHHSGVTDNFGPHSYPAFHTNSNIAVWLHRAGYETGLVGKYLNDYTIYGHHVVPPGWDDWQAIDSIPMEKYYNYTVNENGRLVHYGVKPTDYSTTVLTRKAVAFLRHAHKPFFLYFAPVAPHLPAIPAPQDIGKLAKLAPLRNPALNEANIADKPWHAHYDRTLTRAALEYTTDVRSRQLETLLAVDRSVKTIVHTLAQRRLLKRTIIFYTSDNGFLWGEHRLGGKIWPYEPSTHVPLIVRTPWTAGNGTTDTKPILNIDFASTISEIAGIPPGGPQDGTSFLPFLEGRHVPWRTSYLLEYLGKNKLGDAGPPPYLAIHTSRYLYVEYRHDDWQELYDLSVDPWELRNVAADPAYRRIRLQLRAELHTLYARRAHRAT